MAKVDPNTGEILDHKGRRLTSDGAEIPDPTPIAPPVGYIKQKPLHELIREMVRSERLAQEAAAQDQGSFEDEDDFDVDEDFDPQSPWEENFDPLEGAPEELRNPPSESPVAEGDAGSTKKAKTKTSAPDPEPENPDS